MPLYDYKCTKCDHGFEQFARVADRQKPEAEPCPSCKVTGNVAQCIGLPGIHSGMGLKKPDSGFRDVLKKIQRAHPKGHINTH